MEDLHRRVMGPFKHFEKNDLDTFFEAISKKDEKAMRFSLEKLAENNNIKTWDGFNHIAEFLIKLYSVSQLIESNSCDCSFFFSETGYDKIAEFLIKIRADITFEEGDEINTLIFSFKNGYKRGLDFFLKCSEEKEHAITTRLYSLRLACLLGFDSIIQAHIEFGVDINSTTKTGWDALMFACVNGHNKTVELLINSGADLNRIKSDGMDALMIASMYGHSKTVELLIRKAADVHRINSEGLGALMLAAINGHAKTAELIIENGADVQRTNSEGLDALMIASSNGHYETALVLIKNGAGVNRIEYNGCDALMFASGKGQDITVNLLIESGADVSRIKADGWNALMLASRFGHEHIAEILIQRGAEINRIKSDGMDALMLASSYGHSKTAELLINSGADTNRIDSDGWDALMFASRNEREKTTELLIQCGADVQRIKSDGMDALMIASRKGHVKPVALIIEKRFSTVLNTLHISQQNKQYNTEVKRDFTEWLIIDLAAVICEAFEKKHIAIIDLVSGMIDNYCVSTRLNRQLKCLCTFCRNSLKQDVQNVTKKVLSDLIVSEQNCRLVNNFMKSIDYYVKTVLFSHNEEIPSYDDLLEFVSDVMSEFSNMRDFDALHFFMYQRCLERIYSVLNTEQKLKFFTLLLDLNYGEKTMQFVQDEHLLNTTAPGFTLSLIRDVLSLLWNGSHYSSEFALQLAEKNIINIFTDFLTSIKDVQNSHTLFITKNVIAILHNIARREGAKKYFTGNMSQAVLGVKFMDKKTLFTSHLLLIIIEEESPTIKEAIASVKLSVKETLLLAVREDDSKLFDLPLSELLQGLGKLAERDEDLNEIIPLLPRLTEILKHEDTDEHLFTTKCISELSRSPEVSQQITIDEDLSDLLNKSLSLGNKDITANVHSARWRSGRAKGRLPPNTDILVSDEFPKEFKIDPTLFAKGAFGSVHFIIDINRPEDVQFVAKKTLLKFNDADKCKETFQQEASILISLKHERIVQFHGFQKTETELLLFLEFVKMGTLSAFVKQHTRLNEALTRQFTIQILEGVKYLHENKIVHLDIKGNNILMADEENIKLTDFGLSTILNEEEGVEAERGTTRYMAPEMIDCPDGRIFKHCCSLDIWSVGSTVVEMVTGLPPNSTTASVNVIIKRANLEKPKYNLPIESSIYLHEFLEKTFRPHAAERPSAETLLKEDTFVTGYI